MPTASGNSLNAAGRSAFSEASKMHNALSVGSTFSYFGKIFHLTETSIREAQSQCEARLVSKNPLNSGLTM